MQRTGPDPVPNLYENVMSYQMSSPRQCAGTISGVAGSSTMTRQAYRPTTRIRPNYPGRSGNLTNIWHIIATGNLRTAAAMALAGIVCMWTCVQQRATGNYGLRRRQVLLLTYYAPPS